MTKNGYHDRVIANWVIVISLFSGVFYFIIVKTGVPFNKVFH